jgi:glycosyltransferase involved in cell wall biosynthesis
LLQAPIFVPRLVRKLAQLRPDVAICAMPGPLDLLFLVALRRARVPVVVFVHDADPHPGDTMPLVMILQRALTRRADGVVALSDHVAARLIEQGLVSPRKLFIVPHPPFMFGPMPPPPRAHSGPLRLLCFGRLLPYKGLDLLAAAMRELGSEHDWQLRVVGSGPESADLDALRALPGVTVENRWVPEDEVGSLIAWADAVVLPYKEASQSGVAPAAIAAGRFVVSTRVGGLVEQLREEQLALLCEPNAASLAEVLSGLLRSAAMAPNSSVQRDPRAAWHAVAERLLGQIASSVLGQPVAPAAGSDD